MRLAELHLKAFGPFTDLVLPLGTGEQRLVLVHGLNEAGKSSALRAMKALRFGLPARTPDNFLHDYAHLRIGGVFVDAEGQRHALMRRKGTGQTLRHFDPAAGGVELADAVLPGLVHALNAGLAEADYQTLFGLDHASLRAGGAALARGEGEIGAALFEASAGVADVTRVLTELDATARRFYLPSAAGRHARINQALADYKAEAERHRGALVRPAQWETVHRSSQAAREALAAAQAEHLRLNAEHLRARELIAVAPLLASLGHARSVLAGLADAPRLAENAAAERAAAEAGLAQAQADMRSAEAAVAAQAQALAQRTLDPAALAVAPAIVRLHAAAATLAQLRTQRAAAQAEEARAARELAAVAASLSPDTPPDTLLQQVPGPAARTRLQEVMAACEEAERALAQHRRQAPDAAALPTAELPPVPSSPLQSAVRAALGELARHEASLQALERMPAALEAGARGLRTRLDATGLPDEAAARRARPLLGADIDEAIRADNELRAQRADRLQRLGDAGRAQAEVQRAIDALLAQGLVHTHDDVQAARGARDQAWQPLRRQLAGGTSGGAAVNEVSASHVAGFEQAVALADHRADQLARDAERVARLTASRQQAAALATDITRLEAERADLDQRLDIAQAQWAARLHEAGLPLHGPAALRDWQERLAALLTALDQQAALEAEHRQLEATAVRLSAQLREAVHGLGLSPVDRHASLRALQALAEADLKQVEALTAARNHAAGQAEQLQRLAEQHARRDADLLATLSQARAAFAAEAAALRLEPQASLAVARARLGEFDRLAAAADARDDARARADGHAAALKVHDDAARHIAAALGEAPPADAALAAEVWSLRADRAQATQAAADLAAQRLAAAEEAVANHRAQAARHQATLTRLCASAQVASVADLPEAEARSARRHQAERDESAAARGLAQASRRSSSELAEALAGRTPEALHADETAREQALAQAAERVEQARRADEVARRELDVIDAADTAAAAADAMNRAAATVRHTLPLQLRSRLAHALLQDAVRRFKERSQGPMLASASRHFARLTGGEFAGLQHDDAQAAPVIVGLRPGGATLEVQAMSEGTRDQLYLALRLAALELQRARGVDLPVILDDVLMTSDDRRATHILQALADFSIGGQVIVFTHHTHLCEVARQAVDGDRLAVVELRRA